jgi:hypothetical protein
MSNNSWVEHIKQVAKKENLPFPLALIRAKETYTKKDTVAPTPKPSPKKNKPVVDVPPVKMGKKNLKN